MENGHATQSSKANVFKQIYCLKQHMNYLIHFTKKMLPLPRFLYIFIIHAIFVSSIIGCK